jgi:hypothetical protein
MDNVSRTRNLNFFFKVHVFHCSISSKQTLVSCLFYFPDDPVRRFDDLTQVRQRQQQAYEQQMLLAAQRKKQVRQSSDYFLLRTINSSLHLDC